MVGRLKILRLLFFRRPLSRWCTFDADRI